MFPIASNVLALLNENQPQKLRITGTDTNGVAISITDADVMQGGFSIDRFSCSGTKLEIGSAGCAELKLRLDNFNGAFTDYAFEGAELKVEIGVEVQGASDPFWIACGYFIIDEQERKLNTINLSGLDRMIMAEFEPPQLVPWTDNNDNFMTDNSGNVLYFNAGMAFPATVKDVVDQVCRITGLTLGTDISSFPNANYTISTAPAVPGGTTFRDYIKWAAALMGKCAYIDWRGLLCFGWYEDADYTSETSTRFNSDLYENDIVITGITYTDDDDNLYVAGTQTYAIDVSGNRLIGSNPQSAIAAIYGAVGGFTYRPVSASIMPAPYLWPLDMIAFVDRDGVSHEAALTNVNLTVNASTEIQSKGETEQRNAYARTSGMTLQQAIAMRRAQKAAADAVNALDLALTQQEIFDRLTDGGLEQGLALEATTNEGPSAAGEKKLFLNLDYARFGQLVADYIAAGAITAEKIAAGAVTAAKIAADAITADMITAGTMSAERISGGTLTLGGTNNTNGQIAILDASGNTYGQWNNDGLYIGNSDNHVKLQAAVSYEGGTPTVAFYAKSLADVNVYTEVFVYDGELIVRNTQSDYQVRVSSGRIVVEDGTNDVVILPTGIEINGNTGATGTFTTADGKTVTVTNGLITGIA